MTIPFTGPFYVISSNYSYAETIIINFLINPFVYLIWNVKIELLYQSKTIYTVSRINLIGISLFFEKRIKDY